MIIDCISDLHGYCPDLEGGGLLIIAGDLTGNDSYPQWNAFFNWLDETSDKYKRICVIGGNHDNVLLLSSNRFTYLRREEKIIYLEDSGTEFDGLKIWGSPWTKTFEGMNPHCKAFTFDNEEELAEKWALIPDDTEILITHSPPCGILDQIAFHEKDAYDEYAGSESLAKRIVELKKLRLHIFGHIHEHGGQKEMYLNNQIVFINASHVNENYRPVNRPIRIEL
jgi:Predicted phosphoesterases, related to the Icc protein